MPDRLNECQPAISQEPAPLASLLRTPTKPMFSSHYLFCIKERPTPPVVTDPRNPVQTWTHRCLFRKPHAMGPQRTQKSIQPLLGWRRWRNFEHTGTHTKDPDNRSFLCRDAQRYKKTWVNCHHIWKGCSWQADVKYCLGGVQIQVTREYPEEGWSIFFSCFYFSVLVSLPSYWFILGWTFFLNAPAYEFSLLTET